MCSSDLKPINVAVLKARVRTHVALASRRAALEDMVRERTAKLEEAHVELIRCLGRAMEAHESAAAGNRFRRIGQYSKLIAQALGAKPAAAELLEKAAPMHDIGKLSVPAEILRKPGKLSVPDWERVRRHPEYGAAIIGQHEDPLLQLARTVALTHHENWDGTGYPKGLKGDAIPWPGRVVAIADSFEAMTTTQFYHDPLPVDQAALEIVKGAGKRYGVNRLSLWNNADYTKTIGDAGDKFLETSLTTLREDTDVDWRPRVAQWPAIGETMAKIVQASLVGQVKPKQALDDAQQQVERIMKGG